MNLIEIFSILIIHFLADFVLQTDKQAKCKSKNNRDLISHTTQYSCVWLIFGSLYCLYYELQPIVAIYFYLITLICHTTTDYFTSRINSKLWAQGKTHLFFVSVGFDQILHYVQLFLTYWFLAGKN